MNKTLARLRTDPRVESAYREDNRNWIHLRSGFCCDKDCHTMSGTIKEIQSMMRFVRPCSCAECGEENR